MMNNSFYKENSSWHLKMAERELTSALRSYEQSLINLARGRLIKSKRLEKAEDKLRKAAQELKKEIMAITENQGI